MNQVTMTTEAFSKTARDAAAFGRGNFEAVAQSAQAYLLGTQELSRQTFALAQDLNTQALDGAKAMLGQKSLKEVADIKALYARATLDRVAGEASRLQQAALQVFERPYAPLAQRATTATPQAA